MQGPVERCKLGRGGVRVRGGGGRTEWMTGSARNGDGREQRPVASQAGIGMSRRNGRGLAAGAVYYHCYAGAEMQTRRR